MPPRPFVDPRFPCRLRELRTAAGLSLRQLAGAAYIAKSTLSELESGTTGPSVEMATHLDRVLNADGRLIGMVTPAPEPDPEHRGRVAYALTRPARVDAATVEALAGVLAGQRRLDDTLDAGAMLPWVEPQRVTVARLAREARGRHARAAASVAAEWTQFSGWLCAEARHDALAVRLLDQARTEALELGDGPLAANAADFRAFLARARREWRHAARWSLAAAETVGATRLQQAQNLSHAAYALTRMGDLGEAARLLGKARDLADRDEAQPDTAYWLSAGFLRLGIGLALLGARDRAGAAEQLHAGLAGLPQGWADAEWAAEYRTALAAL